MNELKTSSKNFAFLPVAPSLRNELRTISDHCTNCRYCKIECAFLQAFGKPKQIADDFDPTNDIHRSMAFQCSLCQLCAKVCPEDINPASLFLEMRREAVRTGSGHFREHNGILGYEKRGTSRRYSYYAFPKGCDTVLFPGCALPGTTAGGTRALFDRLRKTIPTLGIVLDCCTKPSYDLGRVDFFNAMFGEMRAYLIRNGIRHVLVACPSCYLVFKQYGGGLSVRTAYEFLAQIDPPKQKQIQGTVAVHDPCGARYESAIHEAVRSLCRCQGLSIEEMPHHKERSICCGEGGCAGCITPQYAKQWGRLLRKETNGNRIITYCAGCTSSLNGIIPISHVVDLLLEPEATMAGKIKISKPPFTYWNRLKLKKWFQKRLNAAVMRERTYTVEEAKQ